MVPSVRCEREAQTRREVEFATPHENLRILLPPNGWRLSGDGGEADGVRCSRGLGGLAIDVFAIGDSDDEHNQLGIAD